MYIIIERRKNMAFFEISYYSKALNRSVPVSVILPEIE